MKPITVYYRPSCAFSAGVASFLLLRGADFHLVNLGRHPEQEAQLRQRLGERPLETPTLEVEGELLVAPSNSELKGLLPEWGLPEGAAPYVTMKREGVAGR
jgi:glutaredoxin